MSIRVHPWLVLSLGGPRKGENGEVTTKSTKCTKMGQERLRQAHLREFAFICGPFWTLGRFRRAGNADFEPQMDANGHKWGTRKRFSAGKQEMGTKTGGETGLHRVFLLFPVFLLGLLDRWLSDTAGWVNPPYPMGKRKTNYECRMSKWGGFGGPAKADSCRKWTQMGDQEGIFSRKTGKLHENRKGKGLPRVFGALGGGGGSVKSQ